MLELGEEEDGKEGEGVESTEEVICAGDSTVRMFPPELMARLVSSQERRRAVCTWGICARVEAWRDHSARQRVWVWGRREARRVGREEGVAK